jgi:hypothetical protein
LAEVEDEKALELDAASEEIMKHLDELKRELASPRPESTGSASSNDLPHVAPSSSYSIRIKAERASESLLSDSDAKTFLSFIDFYTGVYEKAPELSVEDALMLRAFNMFEGDVDKAAAFLPVFEELCDLGFETDEVISALLLHENDREAALDYLMK